jgi:hypothetical protein
MLNPYAPPVIQGIAPINVQGLGYVDVSYGYPYNVTLTASQFINDQQVAIGMTADFLWRGLLFVSTGNFNVRFYDGDHDPFPYFPEVWYPAGGRILLDIQDTSDDTNVIQILFMGANRYRLS